MLTSCGKFGAVNVAGSPKQPMVPQQRGQRKELPNTLNVKEIGKRAGAFVSQ